MERTKIQWCDSTVNPTSGCDGCELRNDRDRSCYAGRLHPRLKHLPGYGATFEAVGLHPGRTAEAAAWSDLAGKPRAGKPWLDGLPRLVFVSDMADALSEAVTFDYLLAEVVAPAASAAGRRHRWLWLTKRPGRMAEFWGWLADRGVGWPANLWPGTSLTTEATAARIALLLRVGPEGTRHFLSVEPERGPIDLAPWLSSLAWVIQGGQSGHRPQPFDLAWARSLRDACARAGVPYFCKQLGARAEDGGGRLPLVDSHGGGWAEWPADLRVRQVPAAA